MRGSTLAAFLAVGFLPTAVLAKEQATFIEGTFATEAGCAKLEALGKGTPRNVETVPDVLTKDGFQGWEGSCEFTRIDIHEPGKVWIGLMYCVEGATMAPQTYAFIKGGDGSLEVAATGEDEPQVYRRCDADKGKK